MMTEERRNIRRQSGARSATPGRPPPDEADPLDHPPNGYVLRLFVSGNTPRSLRAVENIKRICEEYLKGRYELEVIDLYQQPALAAQEDLLAAPTLVKHLPMPLRRVVGDMNNEGKVLVGLDLRRRE